MTTEIIRWRGGPGAGKTHALLGDVGNEVASGRTIHDMRLMTFSRSQASDMAIRLHTTVFPEETGKTIHQRCSTIDATALRSCRAHGLIEDLREQVITPGDSKKGKIYSKFMEERNIPYNPTFGVRDREDLNRSSIPFGNALVAMGAYLTANMLPPEQWIVASSALGLRLTGSPCYIPDILTEWSEYKEKMGVYEHADYVQLALVEKVDPPGRVLFVDEYQDVSPLQDALLRHWMNHPDTARVYLAGDPDQSIYGFRGASPDLFLRIPAEDRGAREDGSRPESHRCPIRIMGVAEQILGKPANVAPKPQSGFVYRVSPTGIGHLVQQVEEARKAAPNSPVFILSRFKRHTRSIAKDLSTAGIPCVGIRDRWVARWGNIRVGKDDDCLEDGVLVDLWTLTKGLKRYITGSDIDPITAGEAENILTAVIPPSRRQHAIIMFRVNTKNTAPRVGHINDLIGEHLGNRVFGHLNLRPWAIQQVEACIARENRGGSTIPPHMVKIDTIHAAKGLETEVVMLHTGYLKGMVDILASPLHRAEEARIYYVGATRAAHVLIFFDWGQHPACPLLSGVGRWS